MTWFRSNKPLTRVDVCDTVYAVQRYSAHVYDFVVRQVSDFEPGVQVEGNNDYMSRGWLYRDSLFATREEAERASALVVLAR